MRPRLDTLYIYLQRERSIRTASFKKIDQRHYESDFRFLRGNVPDVADDVYRYALTVEINEVKRTFVLVTLESSTRKVKSFFDKSLKQIEEDPKLLRQFVLSKAKPTETSIKYGN